jgi:hypothetical protein
MEVKEMEVKEGSEENRERRKEGMREGRKEMEVKEGSGGRKEGNGSSLS